MPPKGHCLARSVPKRSRFRLVGYSSSGGGRQLHAAYLYTLDRDPALMQWSTGGDGSPC